MGLDLSLNSTGVAYFADGKLYTTRVVCKSFRDARRLSFVKGRVEEHISRAQPDLVVIEGYSMGNRGRRGNTFSIAELGGVIKTLVWELGVDHMLVPPTTMKSVVALSGALKDKVEISKALLQHYGFTVTQNDEADAVGLLLVGELKLGVRAYPHQGKEAKRLLSLNKLTIARGR